MPYVKPETVVAPRKSLRRVEVLYDGEEDGWSVARLDWNGKPVLGIRWNGGSGPGQGNPQSHGKPTWFVVPEALETFVLQWIDEHLHAQPGGLLDGYRAMAADGEREVEAQEWSEGLIGDGSSQ